MDEGTEKIWSKYEFTHVTIYTGGKLRHTSQDFISEDTTKNLFNISASSGVEALVSFLPCRLPNPPLVLILLLEYL